MYTSIIYQIHMNDSKPIKIRPKLFQELEAARPEVFTETTTWVNYLVSIGLNFHLGLDPYGRLGKPTDKEEKKKEERREVLPITNSSNNINKKKNKRFSLNTTTPPHNLEFCRDLIEQFWEVKKGSHSKEAYELLIGHYGLLGIRMKYGREEGERAVKEQLQEAIANQWQSITLKNYELYGRPKKDVTEPMTNHPAQNVFKASDIYGD